MNILLVSATYLEISTLLKNFEFNAQTHQKLNHYTFKNHQIDVLITGIGMTHTAYWLAKTLTSANYNVAINLGLAGSFDEKLKIGQTVHVTSDRISELGAEDGEDFISFSAINLTDNKDDKIQNGEIINKSFFTNKIITNLINVKGITVNTVHGNEASIQKVVDLFHPQVESMEGASFLYVCLAEEVPCLQIRAISNKVEKRNKANWNISLALENLTETTLKLLKTL